jgi:fatty acid desaturase
MTIPETFLDELRPRLAAASVFEPATRYYTTLGAGLAILHVAAYGALLCAPGWSVRGVMLGVAVFTSVQLALIAHDAAHGAIARRRWQRSLVGHLSMSFVNGYSFAYFTATHLAHHAFPNDPTRDPDMRPEGFSVHAPWPPEKRGLARVVRRYQAWLLPFGLCLWAFALRGNGLVHALRHRPETRVDLAAVALHAIVWLFVPLAVLGPIAALANYLVISALIGIYLAGLFIPNHVGMPIVSSDASSSYLARQAATSRNFGGSAVVAFLAGGLDSQIEHHLVPNVPNVRLRRARVVVRDFCARHAIPYAQMSYVTIWRDVLAQFDRVGRTAEVP